jgi:hypothetical protein
MNTAMKPYRKIYHTPLEVKGNETRYYLVFTEVCLLTNRIITTYTARMPEWVADNENPDYEFYQPIFN